MQLKFQISSRYIVKYIPKNIDIQIKRIFKTDSRTILIAAGHQLTQKVTKLVIYYL